MPLAPLDLHGRIGPISADFTSIIDWGCGTNDGPISSQVRDIRCAYLLSIDTYIPYIEAVMRQSYAAIRHAYWTLDVVQAAHDLAMHKRRHDAPLYDLSLCLDVIEHLEFPAAAGFLRTIEGFSKRVLIWLPLGLCPITTDPTGGDNAYYHTHRSTWTREILEKLGYTCEVFPGFHEHFTPPVDACWAEKRISL